MPWYRARASAAAAEVCWHRPPILDGPCPLHLEGALPHHVCQHSAAGPHECGCPRPKVHPHGLRPTGVPLLHSALDIDAESFSLRSTQRL